MRCTCPDARILRGENYLKQIMSDSLKQYNFDYSEIYLAGEVPKFTDYFSHDNIIITGEIIGKKRVYENAPWNPLFKITNWDAFTRQKYYLLITFLSLQLLVYIALVYKKNIHYNHYYNWTFLFLHNEKITRLAENGLWIIYEPKW